MKILFFVLTLLPALAFAKGYGVVTLVRGKAIQQTADGQKNEIKKGDKIFETDTITTFATSVVRIVMMDTNIIDIYPNSKLLIKEYIYEPKQDKKNVRLEVSMGRIKSTVKQKYDNDRNKYQVKTPVVIAGVRGTIFTAEHESASGLSRIRTLEGNVMVGRIEAGEQVKEFFSVKANQTVQVDHQTEKPQVKDVPKAEVERQKEQDKKDGFTLINKGPVNLDSAVNQSSRQALGFGKSGKDVSRSATAGGGSAVAGSEQISAEQREHTVENLREQDKRLPASSTIDSSPPFMVIEPGASTPISTTPISPAPLPYVTDGVSNSH